MNSAFTRRQFLTTLTVAGSAIALGTLVGADDSTPAQIKWAPVGKASDFTAGTPKLVTLTADFGGEEVFVTKSAKGDLEAWSARCTHKGCNVAWHADVSQFVCPCHKGTFDATGAVVSGPPKKPLVALKTKVADNGDSFVEAPKPFVRPAPPLQ
jgi:Rieske Fe-S protein